MKRGLLSIICFALVLTLSLSFISAGFFGDLWSSITGEDNVLLAPSCIDTDGGSNYFESGVATGIFSRRIGKLYEWCYEESWENDVAECSGTDCYLVERYCDGLFIRTELDVQCDNGCKNGYCIEIEPTCSDNDGGKVREIKGHTEGENGIFDDYCSDLSQGLIEFYCDENYNALSEVVDCAQYGEICEGGVCRDVSVEPFCGDGVCNGDETVVNCPEDCFDNNASLSLELSLATLKYTYQTGERVELTDPPLNTNEEIYYDMRSTNQRAEVYNSARSINKADYDGYIIQFEDEPILVRKKILEDKAKKAEDYLKNHPVLSTVSTYRLWAFTSDKIPGRIQQYSNNLNINNERVKARIFQKIKTNQKLRREYSKVFNGISLDVSSQEAEDIKKIEGVKRVYHNYQVNATLMDSVPLINADDVWQLDANGNDCLISGEPCLTGEGITIGIIDTGIDYSHGDLGGCFGEGCKVVGGYDFVNDDNDPMDDHGHGTHCAGTAAGNGVLNGVAPGAKLYAYKVLDFGGGGSSEGIIAAIERSMDPNEDGDFSDHLDVISLSLGLSCWSYDDDCGPDDAMSQAIDVAVDAGVVAVIAAGNSGSFEGTIGSPGTSRKAITVGATYKQDYPEGVWFECTPGEYVNSCGDYCGEDGRVWCEYWDLNPMVDQITRFSSRGPVIGRNFGLVKPDIVAPGAMICAARYDSIFPEGDHPFYKPCLDEEHVQMAGTSMAAPHIAGVVALVKQAHLDWTPEEIKSSLKNTAIDVGEEINSQGWGRVDVLSAVEMTSFPSIANIQTEGNIYGEIIEIIGTAKGDNFSNYNLFYQDAPDEFGPGEFVSICSSNQQVDEEILCNWNMPSLSDGEYLLKLEVFSEDTSVAYSYIVLSNTEIIVPKDLATSRVGRVGDPELVLISQGSLEIIGTSAGVGFDYYGLELLDGETGSEVELPEDALLTENDGSLPVLNDRLGILDLSTIVESGFYEIILTTHIGENIERAFSLFYLETDLMEGWPIKTIESSYLIDQPAIADINMDGYDDLVFSTGYEVVVLDYMGNPLNGWPIEMENYMTSAGPSVGDLDNDGDLEIVVGDNEGMLYAFNHDGTYFFGPLNVATLFETASLEDLDNDGDLEIVIGDWNGQLNILSSSGQVLNTVYLESSITHPYMNMIRNLNSIGDLNNDGLKEIVVVTTSCDDSSSCYEDQMASRLWVLDSDGNVQNNWPKDFPRMSSNPILADINEDGVVEIIFGNSESIHVFDYYGNEINGWPVLVNPPSSGQVGGVSVGDLDRDGTLEVVFTASDENNDYCVYAYTSSGNIFGTFPYCGNSISYGFWETPSIVDIDLDEEMEIITSSVYGLIINNLVPFYALNLDGSIVDGFPKYLTSPSTDNSIPVGDLDGDGDNELFLGTWHGSKYFYDLPGDSSQNEWEVVHHDAQNTGNYHFKPTVPPPQEFCGNNVQDIGEECDGTSDLACENRCSDICTCLPKSMLNNTGTSGVSGKLLMKVQMYEEQFWVDKQIVVNEDRTILARDYLALDIVWNNTGAYTPTEIGTYRVYVSFEDVVNNLFVENNWKFSVV